MKNLNYRTFMVFLTSTILIFSCSTPSKKESYSSTMEYSPNNIICSGAHATAFSFIKSVITLDTISFYSLINSDSIINQFKLKNKNSQELNNVNAKNLHELYFLKYGPWKILPQKLEILKKSEFPFNSYNLEVTEQSEIFCKLRVYWIKESGNSKNQIILTLRKENAAWKIMSSNFDEFLNQDTNINRSYMQK